jgi:NitT/TauT family transport system substrate-binding protein
MGRQVRHQDQYRQVNDYVESVNQYNAGKFDGVTLTNMDALTIPAAGGKDTSAIIVGDYSNGNDGVLLKGANSVAALKGKQIYLVELSVSHYLLARALGNSGLSLSDVKTVNTSDADIVGAFSSPDAQAAVAWNPQLSVMRAQPGANRCFPRRRFRAKSSICWPSIPPRSRPTPRWARPWPASGMKPWR